MLSGTIMGCPVSGQTTGTVNNVAPVPPQFSLFNDPDPLGGPLWTVGVSVEDVGVQDYETVTINWGDGSVPTVVTLLEGQYQEVLHEFPPWELHEVPGPYLVTATIADDDTGGAAWGPAGALMYVLDIDNDADNDFDIDPADDPIEYVAPGRFMLANLDDDNDNGVADYYDPGPVLDEDDLEEFQLAFAPTIRQDVQNYDGWKVTLDVVPGKGAGPIWETAYKTGPVVLPKSWIVGTDAIPASYYLEAPPQQVSQVEHWLQLRLTPPDNETLIVDTDDIVFTAKLNKLIMVIGHGISHELAPFHAYTVANLNDTDGDGVEDLNDDVVKNTIQGVAYEELDLMPLAIKRPDDYDGAGLTLTVNGQNSAFIKFWKKKTKEEPIPNINDYLNTWGEEETAKQIWVEATAISAEVKDIELELKYKDHMPAKVFITAIWAVGHVADHGNPNKNPQEVFAILPEIDDEPAHDPVEARINDWGGTGLIPPGSRIANGIVMEFTVTPKEVDQTIVKLDVSRRKEWNAIAFDDEANVIPNPMRTCSIAFPDAHPDAANDDESTIEESELMDDDTGLMYSYDAPGVPVNPELSTGETIDVMTVIAKFEEFIRINISKTFPSRPAGSGDDMTTCTPNSTVSGSRASEMVLWSARHTLQNDGVNLARSTGDIIETASNYVREGH